MIDHIALIILAYITYTMGAAIEPEDQNRLVQLILVEPGIEYREHEEGRS